MGHRRAPGRCAPLPAALLTYPLARRDPTETGPRPLPPAPASSRDGETLVAGLATVLQPLTDDTGLGWTYFPRGEHVVRTSYESGLVTVIEVSPSAWVAAACRAANRDLTADESAQLRPGQLTRPTCPA